MKKKEKKVIASLVKAYNRFIELPVMHPSDQAEFCQGINALQNIVMSREAIRAEPKLFKNINKKKIKDDKEPPLL